MSYLKYCPKCGSDETVTTSSMEFSESEVTCNDCSYQIRRRCPENEIEEYWDSLKRKPQEDLIKQDV